MKVALTGAAGFVGSHVLTELIEHGHQVTALVRDAAHADAVTARGATSAVVDLHDRPTVVRLLSAADGAVHTASPGDATSADIDSAVVDAAIDAYAGTGKPYVQISGTWVYGANPSISEQSPFNAPALVAWNRLAPGRGRQSDHDRHRAAALVNRARRRPCKGLPAGPGRRYGARLLRHRRRPAPDSG